MDVPTYRLLTNALGSQYIDLITATDATEVPTFDFDNYTDMQNGTTTDADKIGVRMLIAIAALPNATRPLVTDYLAWGMINVPYTSDAEYVIDNGTSITDYYPTARTAEAIALIQANLLVLGLTNAQNGPSEILSDVTSLTVGGTLTLTNFPGDWSGPTLIP